MSKKSPYFLITICIITILFSVSCETIDWASVEQSEDVDVLWRFVQANPDDVRASEARARIAAIEFTKAREQNTLYAYRVFLERHPGSVQAVEARHRIELLDFESAQEKNSRESWEYFLRVHPRGEKTEAANAALDRILCSRLEVLTLEQLEEIRKSRSGLPCAQLIDRLRQDRAFDLARKDEDPRAMLELVERYPDHPAAIEFQKRLVRKNIEELVKYAKFKEALGLALSRAELPDADRIADFIRRKKTAWVLESFDPAEIKALIADGAIDEKDAREFIAGISKDRKTTEALRAASAMLRRPVVDVSGIDISTDPKKRWEYATMLSWLPEESSAETLLSLLGDSYIEVRRQALASLRAVLENMGRVRMSSWLSAALAKHRTRARDDVLLLRLYILELLSGDTARADGAMDRLLSSRDEPDPFVLSLGVRHRLLRGREREAAAAARAFSEQAALWRELRLSGWSAEGGLGGTDSAWLTLRQLHGLLAAWRETLEPFESGRAKTFADDFGPWLEKSRTGMEALRAWHADQEQRWERSHPGYVPSAAPAPFESEQRNRQREEAQAALWLAVAGPEPSSTLEWAGCCHPREQTRTAAALASWFYRVRRGVFALGSPG